VSVQGRYSALRGILITFGIGALGFLFARNASRPSLALVLGGLAVQALLVLARWLAKRHAPDEESAQKVFLMLELVGNGATVLLFALGTLGGMRQAMEEL